MCGDVTATVLGVGEMLQHWSWSASRQYKCTKEEEKTVTFETCVQFICRTLPSSSSSIDHSKSVDWYQRFLGVTKKPGLKKKKKKTAVSRQNHVLGAKSKNKKISQVSVSVFPRRYDTFEMGGGGSISLSVYSRTLDTFDLPFQNPQVPSQAGRNSAYLCVGVCVYPKMKFSSLLWGYRLQRSNICSSTKQKKSFQWSDLRCGSHAALFFRGSNSYMRSVGSEWILKNAVIDVNACQNSSN